MKIKVKLLKGSDPQLAEALKCKAVFARKYLGKYGIRFIGLQPAVSAIFVITEKPISERVLRNMTQAVAPYPLLTLEGKVEVDNPSLLGTSSAKPSGK